MSAENKSVKGEIPREDALKLCKEIREDNERKRFGAGKMQCLFCYRIARNNIEKLCIFAKEMNRGCPQVNRRYDALHGV